MALIVLLQRDLRLHDNPALYYAAEHNQPIIPIYLNEPHLGGASQWWRNKSFLDLQRQLNHLQIPLLYYDGSITMLLERLQKQISITDIYWNSLHLSQTEVLKKLKVGKQFYPNFLFPPDKINRPFKLFAPYWRYCLNSTLELGLPYQPLTKPRFKPCHHVESASAIFKLQESNESAFSLPKLSGPVWWEQMESFWNVGEKVALRRWKNFKQTLLEHYHSDRDLPTEYRTSLLSPHIHFGEISVRQLWQELQELLFLSPNDGIKKFSEELGWREFSYNLLFHNPNLQTQSLNSKFLYFPWKKESTLLDAWKKGFTGYPIIDAAMRQLWQIGWMNNRSRMLVASFLTKNLLIPWQLGEQWFFDTLVDADNAINATNWQWVAGCGTDSAPYFRIFNPILQGKKYDSEGKFIKQWVPELKDYPAECVHEPWLNENSSTTKTFVNYPKPIIDLKQSRKTALDAFHSLSNISTSLFKD